MSHARRAALSLLLSVPLAAGALGCGAAPRTRASGAVAPLAVRTVEWNASGASFGHVHAVADGGEVVAVFSDRGATVLAARSPIALDAKITDWRGAGAIEGADGASWLVGVAGDGRVYRVRGLRALEDVSFRYGLGGDSVRGASALGGTGVAFLLPDGLAVADGARVARYTGGGTFSEIAGAAGFVAETSHDVVRVLDVQRGEKANLHVPGATHAVIGADARLYVSTPRALYAGAPRGPLALVYDAGRDALHGLVASGSVVWFLDGSELALVDNGVVRETTGAAVRADASLAPSASGDVWLLSGGALTRFTRADESLRDDRGWTATIEPVFARSCAACHLAGGVSGTDLSSGAAWEAARGPIRERVLEERSMPPSGHALSDEDRAAIRRWTDAGDAPAR